MILKLLKDTLIGTLTSLVLMASVAYIALVSPMLHQRFLRDYVSSKVVLLTAKSKKDVLSQAGGTGFHIIAPSGKTYIITNRHVCYLSINKTMWASIPSQKDDVQVNILSISKDSDLCLLEPVRNIRGLSVGESPALGQTIAYVGYPRLQPKTFVLGEAVGYRPISITEGVISSEPGKIALTEDQCKSSNSQIVEVPEILLMLNYFNGTYENMNENQNMALKNLPTKKICVATNKSLITTLMIYPGASGSPVVDIIGQVVGVVYSGPVSGGWGYAVMLEDVKKILIGR